MWFYIALGKTLNTNYTLKNHRILFMQNNLRLKRVLFKLCDTFF